MSDSPSPPPPPPSPPRMDSAAERCEEHGESPSMFCLDDLEPLCKHCAAASHAGHRVYPLSEAAADCKEELRTSLGGLKRKMSDLEKVTQTCEHTSRRNRAEGRLTEEHMKREFESLHQFLREEEAARLLALRDKWEEKTREAEGQMERLNRAVASLEEKIQLIEEELDAGGDGVDFLEHYQGTVNGTWAGEQDLEGSRLLLDVSKHLGNLQYAVWEKMKHIAPYTPVTLDPRTAGQSLRVSPGLSSFHVTPGPSQSPGDAVPANPERFHRNSCILGRKGFDSGVHCWDVEVGDCSNWTVGVAVRSVCRRLEFGACPEAGLWCISLRDGQLRALTSPSQTLCVDSPLTRVRVGLDWDGGKLDFRNAETGSHVFTFTHGFTEKLYPYFESVSECDVLVILTQRVNIELESDDYVEVKDGVPTEDAQRMNGESHNDVDINENIKISESGDNNLTTSSKPSRKEKARDAVKKPSRKPRFTETYHVSLNKALNINNQSGNHKQIQMNMI